MLILVNQRLETEIAATVVRTYKHESTSTHGPSQEFRAMLAMLTELKNGLIENKGNEFPAIGRLIDKSRALAISLGCNIPVTVSHIDNQSVKLWTINLHHPKAGDAVAVQTYMETEIPNEGFISYAHEVVKDDDIRQTNTWFQRWQQYLAAYIQPALPEPTLPAKAIEDWIAELPANHPLSKASFRDYGKPNLSHKSAEFLSSGFQHTHAFKVQNISDYMCRFFTENPSVQSRPITDEYVESLREWLEIPDDLHGEVERAHLRRKIRVLPASQWVAANEFIMHGCETANFISRF